VNDGSDVGVDLSGGFYDAGDHVKFTLPMLSAMTLLSWGGIEYSEGYTASGQRRYLLDTIRWGMDWVMKAHAAPFEFYGQVGNGRLDHSYWGPAETMAMPRPAYKITANQAGSEIAAEAAASLAAASILFREEDPAYATLMLTRAEQLFVFADQYRGTYTAAIPDAALYYNSYSGYLDELMWAAAWLHRATNKTSYLEKAETIYNQSFANSAFRWTQDWDNKNPGAMILLAQATGKANYRTAIERWLNFWSVGDNGSRVTTTTGGLAWLAQWASLRYSANTSLMAFIYADTVRDNGTRYADFGISQIRYMLGANPANQSYMVGFGQKSPQQPHHRTAHGSWNNNIGIPTLNRNVLYGALVGGPTRPDDFAYTDSRTDYVANEVALDYNAAFTGALARMVEFQGGTPLANFPPNEEADDEFFVEAAIAQQGSGYMEIQAYLNNRSTFPAEAFNQFSFRYYLDLTEFIAAGYQASQLQVSLGYSQGAEISALRVHDAARKIYYVEVDFFGERIAPGASNSFRREAKFRFTLPNNAPGGAWNPMNDPSFAGLITGTPKLSARIPVFESGVLFFGIVP